MRFRFLLLITSLFILSSSYGQSVNQFLGTWIKNKVEVYNPSTNRFVEKDDPSYLKYTFEKHGNLFMSIHDYEKGNRMNYKLVGGVLDLTFRKFKVEKVNEKELVLIELVNNKISPSAIKIFFQNEQLLKDKIPISNDDFFVVDNDTIYFKSKKIIPSFYSHNGKGFEDFIQQKISPLPIKRGKLGYVTFVLNPNGLLSDIKNHHYVNKKYDKGLITAIQQTKGMWQPVKVNGRKVKVLVEFSNHNIGFFDGVDNIKEKEEGVYVIDFKNDKRLIYEESFKRAIKENLRGNYNNSIEILKTCLDKSIDNGNVYVQLSRLYQITKDDDNLTNSLDKVKKSKYKYVLKN